jgi:hypothetical protein
VHWPALKLPGPLEPKLTVPVGVLAVPPSVSETVAVHVVGPPTATGSGVQLRLVEVERGEMTVRNVKPRLRMLPACLASPPYWAMIVCALLFMGRALGV